MSKIVKKMAAKYKLTTEIVNNMHTDITCVHISVKFELATTKIGACNSLQNNELKS